LYLTGKNDRVLGHPTDVQLLMNETGINQPKEFRIIGKNEGHLHDYDHISLLTHPDAVKDHFPFVLEWLKKNEK
jgi:hypothetical protein